MSREQPSRSSPSGTSSSKVSVVLGLKKEEEEAVQKRSHHVLMAMKKLGTEAGKAQNLPSAQAPVIAVLGSGGGLRAHIACLGVLSEMRKHGLLDAVTYLVGVSGSTWALSSFYAKDGNMEDIEAELEHRFDQKKWDLVQSLKKTIRAARSENYSLTDFWAYLVVSKQTRELQNSSLSSVKKHVEEGTLPYPIFAAIDSDFQPDWEKEKAQKTWFEFTPHHTGYPALGAYIPTTHFGSKFENGQLVRPEPERDLTFLKDQLLSLKEKLNLKSLSAVAVDTAAKLSELVMTCIQDPRPDTLETLQALQQRLEAQQGDEVSESEYSWLPKSIRSWNILPESQDTLGILNVLLKTGLCFRNWEWGTIHNFLYNHGDIEDKEMNTRKLLHLVDAGFAINTAYPLVLPPTREAHLILSFDFSAGDPFGTIRATADYCQHHNIPFPSVEEAKLQNSEAPASCYILKGDTGPVVMHFPLFNTDTCGDSDEIQKWIDTYSTIKLADSYSRDLVTQLLELSKKNVRKNKETILREMRSVARTISSFQGKVGLLVCQSPTAPLALVIQEKESQKLKTAK
ncbi:cytosolic phospholipase A2 gamma [Ctenodactylus gundi]